MCIQIAIVCSEPHQFQEASYTSAFCITVFFVRVANTSELLHEFTNFKFISGDVW